MGDLICDVICYCVLAACDMGTTCVDAKT